MFLVWAGSHDSPINPSIQSSHSCHFFQSSIFHHQSPSVYPFYLSRSLSLPSLLPLFFLPYFILPIPSLLYPSFLSINSNLSPSISSSFPSLLSFFHSSLSLLSPAPSLFLPPSFPLTFLLKIPFLYVSMSLLPSLPPSLPCSFCLIPHSRQLLTVFTTSLLLILYQTFSNHDSNNHYPNISYS